MPSSSASSARLAQCRSRGRRRRRSAGLEHPSLRLNGQCQVAGPARPKTTCGTLRWSAQHAAMRSAPRGLSSCSSTMSGCLAWTLSRASPDAVRIAAVGAAGGDAGAGRRGHRASARRRAARNSRLSMTGGGQCPVIDHRSGKWAPGGWSRPSNSPVRCSRTNSKVPWRSIRLLLFVDQAFERVSTDSTSEPSCAHSLRRCACSLLSSSRSMAVELVRNRLTNDHSRSSRSSSRRVPGQHGAQRLDRIVELDGARLCRRGNGSGRPGPSLAWAIPVKGESCRANVRSARWRAMRDRHRCSSGSSPVSGSKGRVLPFCVIAGAFSAGGSAMLIAAFTAILGGGGRRIVPEWAGADAEAWRRRLS